MHCFEPYLLPVPYAPIDPSLLTKAVSLRGLYDWVTVAAGPAVPLMSTFRHLQLPSEFEYQFVDESIIDLGTFGGHDPRVGYGVDPDICQACEEKQSDDIRLNRCSCFSTLFGGPRGPVAVQLFHTASGKNNGVVARFVRHEQPCPIHEIPIANNSRTLIEAPPLPNSSP